jgi:hypothetical protein
MSQQKSKRAAIVREIQRENRRAPDATLDRRANPDVTVARPTTARALSAGPSVRRITGRGR